MGLTHVGYMQAYFMNVLELNSVLCYAQRCCGLLLGCASNRVCINPSCTARAYCLSLVVSDLSKSKIYY